MQLEGKYGGEACAELEFWENMWGSFKNPSLRGAWMVQPVKCQALGFTSGHDVVGPEIESHLGLCGESA